MGAEQTPQQLAKLGGQGLHGHPEEEHHCVKLFSNSLSQEERWRGALGAAGQKRGLFGYKSQGKEVRLLSEFSPIRKIR